MTVETRYAKSGNASIAYQIVGQGDLDLVLVPCWVSHLDHLWEEPHFVRFVEQLAAFGRVILFDKRGTGLSDPTPLTTPPSLEERMDDLRAVLDATASQRAVLVGVSMGCLLSALFAATYPERIEALVMFGGSARRTWAPDYPWAPTREQHARYLDRLRQEWGGPFDVATFAPSMAHDQRFRDWWAAYLRRSASVSAAVTAARMSAATDIRSILPMIRVPTLVLHRSGDRVIDVAEGRYLAQHIPGAKFVELPGVDHVPFLGDQDRIVDEIGSFITGSRAVPARKRTIATVVALDLLAASATARRADGERNGIGPTFAAIVDRALTRFGGERATLNRTGMVASFDAPARAVGFAKAVVDATRLAGLHTAAGLHTGDVEIGAGEIGGVAVEFAGRIAAQAQPGQILVSRTVRDLVAGSDLTFEPAVDAGTTHLPHDWRLFRLARGAAAATPLAPADRPTAGASTVRPAALSRREREVVALVARGLSNRELADELAISVATAERHVTNILTKLGFRSRTQVAAWATAEMTATPIAAPRRLPRPTPRPAVAAA